jgi:hypothetical protein
MLWSVGTAVTAAGELPGLLPPLLSCRFCHQHPSMSTSHQYNHQHFNLEDTAEARTIIASFIDGQTEKEIALQAGTIEGQQGGHKPPSFPQLLPTPPLSPDQPSQLCMEPLSSSSRLTSTQPHRLHWWQCTADDFAIIAAIFTTSSSTTVHKILLLIPSPPCKCCKQSFNLLL